MIITRTIVVIVVAAIGRTRLMAAPLLKTATTPPILSTLLVTTLLVATGMAPARVSTLPLRPRTTRPPLPLILRPVTTRR